MVVHQLCYGGPLLERLPVADWFCERCRDQFLTTCARQADDSTGCVFCPFRDRAPMKYMKLVDANVYFWAHVQCVNWIPEIGFVNDEYRFPALPR